jgi:lipooligosaccharide transport system permease protein
MSSPLRMVRRNALVYRRTWRGSVFSNFLQPTLYLMAIGVGLGAMIDRGRVALPGGVTFLQFLAPGLLAASAMQSAAFESSYPILGKITWHRNYEAIGATPMSIGDILLGELAWMALRLTTIACAFMLVLTAFGVPRSPMALLAIPVAVLTGLAFSAPIIAWAATLKSSANFNVIFRFGITPLFLFSGVFFPITRMPLWAQRVAWCTPLFHGVELARGLVLNTIESPVWVVHVGYLVAMCLVGTLAGLRTLRRRLQS